MPRTFNVWLATTMLTTVFSLCIPAAAQSMYRCGNTYQAYPCETGQGKVVGNVGAQQSSYQSVSNAECAQRGAESLKIAWSREAGLIQEKALAEVDGKPLSPAKKAEAKKLVADVYHKRGSAPEVRAAIEADCVVEKEKEAQAAAMGRAMNPPGPKQDAANPVSKGLSDPDAKTADPNSREKLAATEAADKKMRCANISRRLADIYRSQRAGDSAQAMERLNQDRRDLQREQSEAGC